MKKQSFCEFEGYPCVGKYSQIITRINIKEAVIFPAKGVALSAFMLITSLATRFGIKGLHSLSGLKNFPKYWLALSHICICWELTGHGLLLQFPI